MSALLIASGQSVVSELHAEFGDIPPAFLPLGNRRLYVHQAAELQRFYDRTCITLPAEFEVDVHDVAALAALDIQVLQTPAVLALGSAVRAALDYMKTEGRIDILFGDTLVDADEVAGTDWIAVGDPGADYHWHYERDDDDHVGAAWAGMFSFSNAAALHAVLARTDDFIAAVLCYAREHRPMERRPLRKWLDFGHVQTYFRSRRAVTTERHFNSLTIVDGVVTKTSEDGTKMLAEAAWFATAPRTVRAFLPNFIGVETSPSPRYSLEYLPLAALNELYVFGRLPVTAWQRIFAACDRYFHAARAVPVTSPPGHDFGRRLYGEKTVARLTEFAGQTGTDIDEPWQFNGVWMPSLREMAQDAGDAVAGGVVPSFVHGDFCFSNILFDFRAERIKLLDPRGLHVDGTLTSFGDFRYDVGKLAHSVVGLYDSIIAGCFTLHVDDERITFGVQHPRGDRIREAFMTTSFAGRTPREWQCEPVMVLLFLSMLPLHADHPLRQRAFMANAMRIYQEWTRDCHPDGGQQPPLLRGRVQPAEVRAAGW
jgi:hypothetical protein